MKFTTHFRLQYQTTLLVENTSYVSELWVKDGIITLYDTLFQKIYTQVTTDCASLVYNSNCRLTIRFSFWAFPGSVALTKGILVSFFSSAY